MAKLTLRVGAIGRWPRNRAKCVSKRTHFGTKKQDIRLYLCTRQLTPSGGAAAPRFKLRPPAGISTDENRVASLVTCDSTQRGR